MSGSRSKKKSPGRWVDEIMDSIGKFIHLETRSGVSREGTLSGLVTVEIDFNKVKREMPKAIEMNGDPFDTIELIDIQRISID